MAATLELIEKEITENEVLYGVRGEQYERLVKKYWNMQCPRMTYDSGVLEAQVTNSLLHESDSGSVALR